MQRNQMLPVLQALLAAVLFGASAPLSKILLNDLPPVTLAGLLYLGSGLSALLFSLARKSIRNVRGQSSEIEAGS
jgi:drug/metabolite transporter (DMT)-like permease